MFLKKLFLIFCFFTLALALALDASAQIPELDDVTDAQLNKEGSIKQRDIDVFIKFVNEGNALNNRDADDDDVAKFANNFLKKNKISLVRLRLLMEKIPIGIMVASQEGARDNYSPENSYEKISKAEEALFKKNLSKLMSVFQRR
jgi:hypothetical protein